jgi:hypothetical protein
VGGPAGTQDVGQVKKIKKFNLSTPTISGVGGPARAQDVVARRAVAFLQQCVFYTPLKISCG